MKLKRSSIEAFLIAAALAVGTASTANAEGCLKGAAVGGIAGHYAGHHAVIGAVGGCIVGRHLAKKHAEEMAAQHQEHQAAANVPVHATQQ